MPVIKHFTGNCHVYVDRAADLDMAERITVNAKCQRMGVCNAAESLVVHADVAADVSAADRPVAGRARRRDSRRHATPALRARRRAGHRRRLRCRISGPDHFGQGGRSLDEAIEHINHYGSQHTDAIVTGDLAAARQFAGRVEASAVMVNASTRFNDGGEFGLGAEIGISTDKFHARGPCGVEGIDELQIRGVRRGAGAGIAAMRPRKFQVRLLQRCRRWHS